jgi:hypothetical protein
MPPVMGGGGIFDGRFCRGNLFAHCSGRAASGNFLLPHTFCASTPRQKTKPMGCLKSSFLQYATRAMGGTFVSSEHRDHVHAHLYELFGDQIGLCWGGHRILVSFLRKETRIKVQNAIPVILESVQSIAMVAVSCAGAGMIVGLISLTGLGVKISSILITIAATTRYSSYYHDDNGIILGMGLPTTAAYIILASMVAPRWWNSEYQNWRRIFSSFISAFMQM